MVPASFKKYLEVLEKLFPNNKDTRVKNTDNKIFPTIDVNDTNFKNEHNISNNRLLADQVKNLLFIIIHKIEVDDGGN